MEFGLTTCGSAARTGSRPPRSRVSKVAVPAPQRPNDSSNRLLDRIPSLHLKHAAKSLQEFVSAVQPAMDGNQRTVRVCESVVQYPEHRGIAVQIRPKGIGCQRILQPTIGRGDVTGTQGSVLTELGRDSLPIEPPKPEVDTILNCWASENQVLSEVGYDPSSEFAV